MGHPVDILALQKHKVYCAHLPLAADDDDGCRHAGQVDQQRHRRHRVQVLVRVRPHLDTTQIFSEAENIFKDLYHHLQGSKEVLKSYYFYIQFYLEKIHFLNKGFVKKNRENIFSSG